MRFLTDAEVSRLVTVEDAVEALTEAFLALCEGRAAVQWRQRTSGAIGKLSTVGAVLDTEEMAGAKVYTTGIDGSFGFCLVLIDPLESRVLACMEAAELTRIRTTATSLLVARKLARPSSRTLAVFGTGVQARSHCLAFARSFPIEEVRVVHRRAADDFVRRMRSATDLAVTQVEDPSAAVDGAGLVVTATRAAEPLFEGSRVEPGAHVTSVGATSPEAREVDDSLLARADLIVVESRIQARQEAGNLIGAAEAGVVSWEQVVELADLVSGGATGRLRNGEITFFDSLGIGIEDVAVGALVFRRAMQEGVGVELAGGRR